MEVVSTLVFYVNGSKVEEANVDPEFTLIQYLRQKLGLCGTKVGCSEGGCGACTVMVSRYNPTDDVIEHISANACLFPIAAAHGAAITTVEGIGSTKTSLHPIQETIAKSHGTQCGFCTPGFVMSMYTLLRNDPLPSVESIRNCFQGNLCRCTGYRPILEGYKAFSKEASCCGGQINGQCCQSVSGSGETAEIDTSGLSSIKFTPYDPSQEIIFPPELKLLTTKFNSQHLVFENKRVTWIRPTNLASLLQLKSEYKDAQLVVGNTEIGISTLFKNMHFPKLIAITAIPELKEVIYDDNGIAFGAAITLSIFERLLREAIKKYPESKTKVFVAIRNMLLVFAENQIRNVAAIAGNIVTASPISDLSPLLLAANCILKVTSRDGPEHLVKMDSKFFTGYRKTVLKPEEVVVSIHIPFTSPTEHFFGFKQSRRREDDMPIVNAGMMVRFHPESSVIEELRIAYGGMAPQTVYASKTMTSLIGRSWDDSIIDSARVMLAEDLSLDPGAPGGMVGYRQTLAVSFFFKFYLQVVQELKLTHVKLENVRTDAGVRDDVTPIERKVPKSSQLFQIAPSGQRKDDPVGRPEVHKAAFQHASGEAVYCDDIPQYPNELHLGLVTSTRAHAKILSIDASEALALEGIVAFFCHEDVPPERNVYIVNEEIFASKVVSFHGQTIGALVGKDRNSVRRACQLVKVEYEDIKPIIVTLEDAIANGCILKEHDLMIGKGDIEEGFRESEHVLEGEVRIGAQEHFYMEPQGALVVPRGEAGEMTVFSATQNPSGLQHQLAEVLNLPANRIVVQVKRLGGGFGGKEIRSQIPAMPCAIAAQKLNQPVRCIMRRDEDMASTGTRHPFLGKYKVGFSSNGKIVALDVEMHANIGFSLDLSPFIMARAVHHVENAYCIPHMRVRGHLYTSNTSSCTAFRGSGGPQGMLIAESYMDHVAAFLNTDPASIRKLNLYREKDVTHYTQTIPTDALLRCWEQCTIQSDYFERKSKIEQFNRENQWKKRGIAMVPTKFGVSFVVVFLLQGSALVHVYQDGSVLLTHGGVEMGQGLHTKMIQVASRVLEIPSDKIHICETSTDKVPNASTTGASLSSDLNGYAVMYACQTIKERLVPVVSQNKNGSWEDWIKSAYMQRISLSATGFYKTNEDEYSYETNTGVPYHYFTNGVACTEVEIDCLTGHHQMLRTDIVMDVGESINPAIDIGQIEGGFMQGYGMFTLEELRHSTRGFLFTRGPGTYKIPTMCDIPLEFNVSLLQGSSCQRAIYSSKAIGEPPFFLASSAFFALKDAIRDARKEAGIDGHFPLVSPATAERIRMACADKFTEQFPVKDPSTYKPWSVMA